MQFSKFGEKFTKNSGILQLMDDLGNALNSEQPINMLGGGNPARIDTVNQTYWSVFKTLAEGDMGSMAIEKYWKLLNAAGRCQVYCSIGRFF